jgi:hypothetical protein
LEGKGTVKLQNDLLYEGYFREDMRSGIGH